jgi:RNA polymerase sigma-70 factor (ECF subfamily)
MEAEFHKAISSRSDRWFSACLRITHNRALAEDAVQEALLSAWNKRSQFKHDASLDTWIHRIAVNAALQLIRKQRPGMFDALEGDVRTNSDSPETMVANLDLGDSLSAALEKLTEIERVCFVLKHLEQWRLAEIAEELGSSVSSVKQALFRAVKKLRISMTDIKSTGS